ncbi:MAG: FeoA family protein [bacterium]
MNLLDLDKGQTAIISDILSDNLQLETKLREIGIAENDEIEILHFGPIAKNPICVRLNQTMLALREDEATAIQIKNACEPQ